MASSTSSSSFVQKVAHIAIDTGQCILFPQDRHLLPWLSDMTQRALGTLVQRLQDAVLKKFQFHIM